MSLVDILIGTTSLTPEQLLRAEELSAQRGVRLEEVLIQQRFLSEEELLQAQGQQLGMPYWKELPESEFDVALMTKFLSSLLASISWYRFARRMASSWSP
jgi:hypothetical protein